MRCRTVKESQTKHDYKEAKEWAKTPFTDEILEAFLKSVPKMSVIEHTTLLIKEIEEDIQTYYNTNITDLFDKKVRLLKELELYTNIEYAKTNGKDITSEESMDLQNSLKK